MKTKLSIFPIKLMLLALVITSCAPAAQTPMVETATSVPLLPSPTLPPSDTPSPSDTPTITAPLPTETLAASPTSMTIVATATAQPPMATTASPASVLSISPQEGVWSGGATGLILSFRIYFEGAQPMLTDLAILWLGPGECMVDHLLSENTPIQGTQFIRFYNKDDLRYQLSAEIESATLISGVLELRYTGCGERKFTWRAVPAASITPGP